MKMKTMTALELMQVSGGRCHEFYEADVPLKYLPIVAAHVKKLNQRQFDSAAMLQELTDAGLDTAQVNLNVRVFC
jgi:hypothetical protein